MDDANHGKGQQSPQKFNNDINRKEYQAGYHRQQQQNQQKNNSGNR